jgi:phosphoglycolate phosphatase-like HAD superfamily hydrolase
VKTNSYARPESIDTEILCRIQGIIFDVDGTLYDQSALRRRIATRLVGAYWAKPTKGIRVIQALKAYRQAHEELRNQPFSADLQLDAAAAKCGHSTTEVRAAVDQWFDTAPLSLLGGCVYPGVPEFLTLLRELDLACGVFSDYPAEKKLSAMGLKSCFSPVHCAGDVGRQKPDPTGILTVAREMGLDPERTLYIGDRNIDMETATQAGMYGVLVGGHSDWQILHGRFATSRDRRIS